MHKTLFLFLTSFFLFPTWAAGGTGTLVVETDVAGAVVYVDNKKMGNTPFRAVLDEGRHSLRVSAQNFDPWVSRIRIEEGKTNTQKVELFEGGGTVEFVVDPANAEVFIDGQAAGTAPIRLTDLPLGTHRYVISAPLHEGATGEFVFRQGANLLIVEELETSAGKWEVRSTPSGADVYIDDELVGQTPLSATDISNDLHRVRVSKEGYGSVFREVDTQSGERGELTVNLPKGGAEVRVLTRNEDALVRINGNLVGSGKKLTLALQRGVYNLQVEAPGMKPAKARLSAPRRGAVIYKAHLVSEDASGSSSLAVHKPLTSSWAFWGTLGGLGAGAGVTAAVIIIGNQPEPPPDGDVVVDLP